MTMTEIKSRWGNQHKLAVYLFFMLVFTQQSRWLSLFNICNDHLNICKYTFPTSRWHISRPLSKMLCPPTFLVFSPMVPHHWDTFQWYDRSLFESKLSNPPGCPLSSKWLRIRMARVTLEKRTSLAPGVLFVWSGPNPPGFCIAKREDLTT